MRDDLRLRPYQLMAVWRMVHRSAYALWLKPGLGKTVVTLEALHEMRLSGMRGHVLISAPLNVVRSTWAEEIDKWGFDDLPQRYLTIRPESGRSRKKDARLKQYAQLADAPDSLLFVNHDNIVDMVRWFLDGPGGGRWPAPTLILDEAQGFKNYSSNRFQALKRLRDEGRISRIYELTGSPRPKGIEDLWPQLYALGRGWAMGPTISAFRDRYEEPDPHVKNVWRTRKPAAETEARVNRTASRWAMAMSDPGVRLAEPTVDDIMLHMDGSLAERYKTFRKESVLELGDAVVSAANAGVLAGKLAQFASGTLYPDREDGAPARGREYKVVHTLKLDMLERLLANSDSPVLICRWFRSDEAEILKRFGPGSETPVAVFGGTRDEVRAWNRGDIPAALVSPAAMGTGLNLQDGPGHTIVWYTLPMASLMDYEQLNARIHRPGQKDTTVIHRLLVADTFDVKMARLLERKAAGQDRLMEDADAGGSLQAALIAEAAREADAIRHGRDPDEEPEER